ncbi:CU044_2847 family protein [Methanosarcina sp.]|uniref:CU044_2847 family protein n=1 Tax=Methanosarcina sp. TaxID=2213 RepID=UPI002ABC28C6|nr:CU044_2847 family protein [Methanosarcina sp.]MDY9924852.1 CU044_2847 family protein [Methanosarcina sp.]
MNFKGIINKGSTNNEDKDEDKNENKKPNKEPVKIGPLLAELGHAPGTIKMTLVSPKAVEEKSVDSINNAMLLIKEFSRKVGDTVEEIPLERRPSQVQLSFNLRLTTDGRAVITKSDKETNLKVTLMWKHDGKDSEELIEQGKEQHIDESSVKRGLYS